MSLDNSIERERIASEAYVRQQQSYRELEALYSAMTERATQAESERDALIAMNGKLQEAVERAIQIEHLYLNDDRSMEMREVDLWVKFDTAAKVARQVQP